MTLVGTRGAAEFARHETVNHGTEEYVRGDVHTNTIEGYFSILKRGIYGVYHHVGDAHLKRYLAEFDFRYNYRTKLASTTAAHRRSGKGIVGKRLTYRRTGRAPRTLQAVHARRSRAAGRSDSRECSD